MNNLLILSCKWYINTFKNLPIIVFKSVVCEILMSTSKAFRFLYFARNFCIQKISLVVNAKT